MSECPPRPGSWAEPSPQEQGAWPQEWIDPEGRRGWWMHDVATWLVLSHRGPLETSDPVGLRSLPEGPPLCLQPVLVDDIHTPGRNTIFSLVSISIPLTLPGLQARPAAHTQGLEGLGFSLAQIPDKGFHGHYSQFLCALLPPPGHVSQRVCCLGPEKVLSVSRSIMSDCSPPGSSVHESLQARILEWEAIPFSRGISLTQGLNLGLPHCRQIFLPSEPPGKPVQGGKQHTHTEVC